MICTQCTSAWSCFPEYKGFDTLPLTFHYPCNDCIDNTFCMKCPTPDPTNQNVLLCDGCTFGAKCFKCAGVDSIPDGNWYCSKSCKPEIETNTTPKRKQYEAALPPRKKVTHEEEYERFDTVLDAYFKQRADMKILKQRMTELGIKMTALHNTIQTTREKLTIAIAEQNKQKMRVSELRNMLLSQNLIILVDDETDNTVKRLDELKQAREQLKAHDTYVSLCWLRFNEKTAEYNNDSTSYIQYSTAYDLADKNALMAKKIIKE